MSKVDNQYWLALGDQMPTLRGQASICSFAFFEVQDALENGAWDSTTADAFSGELTHMHTLAGDDGEGAGTALETRYDSEPEKVPEDDSRAHWVMPH